MAIHAIFQTDAVGEHDAIGLFRLVGAYYQGVVEERLHVVGDGNRKQRCWKRLLIAADLSPSAIL